MDVGREAALIGVLLVAGAVLITLPMLVPPDIPDDRIEYYGADFVTQHLPRLGSMALGTVCLLGAAYRRFAV